MPHFDPSDPSGISLWPMPQRSSGLTLSAEEIIVMPKPYYLSLDTTPPEDYEPPYELWSAMNLTQLADHFKTDKGTLKHNYTQIYDRYFSPLRIDPYQPEDHKPLALLEIGVACGASLKMWSRYFPHGKITGVDINPLCGSLCKNYPNVQIIIEDAATSRVNGDWDIIIDDGSHVAQDMRNTFLAHWPLLKAGGYYCIEDTGCTLNPGYQRPRKQEDDRELYIETMQIILDNLDTGQGAEFVHFYKELAIIRKLP